MQHSSVCHNHAHSFQKLNFFGDLESGIADVAQVLIGGNFSLCRTAQGQVYYAGMSQTLGLKVREFASLLLLGFMAISCRCNFCVLSLESYGFGNC